MKKYFHYIGTKACLTAAGFFVLALAVSPRAIADEDRSESFAVRFERSSVEIKPSILGNAKVLDDFKTRWDALAADSTITVLNVELNGNASCEGKVLFNKILAANRARSTAIYLSVNYDIDPDLFLARTANWLAGDSLQIRRHVDSLIRSTGIDVESRMCAITINYTVTTKEEPKAEVDSLQAVAPIQVEVQEQVVADSVSQASQPVAAPEEEKFLDKCPMRLKTNLLYDAVTVANLSYEIGFARHWSFEMLVTWSPWDISNTFKIRTLMLQPEFRYYLKEGFKGHYFGLEGHTGWYNVAFPDSPTRYQDKDGNTPMWGLGVTYGYVLEFNRHWGMDFNIGLGYANFQYDCFYNLKNGAKYTTDKVDWWGPTKLGAMIYYRF